MYIKEGTCYFDMDLGYCQETEQMDIKKGMNICQVDSNCKALVVIYNKEPNTGSKLLFKLGGREAIDKKSFPGVKFSLFGGKAKGYKIRAYASKFVVRLEWKDKKSIDGHACSTGMVKLTCSLDQNKLNKFDEFFSTCPEETSLVKDAGIVVSKDRLERCFTVLLNEELCKMAYRFNFEGVKYKTLNQVHEQRRFSKDFEAFLFTFSLVFGVKVEEASYRVDKVVNC